jgi:hypothetical protein
MNANSFFQGGFLMNVLRNVGLIGLVAFSLTVSPAQLMAGETASRAPERAALSGWLSSAWSGLTELFREGSCAIDPNGCPMGDAPAAQSFPETIQGSCAVDPLGGCLEHR